MKVPSDAQAALLALVQDHLPAVIEWVECDESLHPRTLGRDQNPFGSKANLKVERIDRETNTSTFEQADDYRWSHRVATVRACIRHGWLDGLHERTVDRADMGFQSRWHLRQLDLTEDGMIALGVWRERKLKAPPADLPTLTDREREIATLAHRALELGYALCPREPARAEARRLRAAGWFRRCWIANSAYALVPTPMAVVEVRPDLADALTEPGGVQHSARPGQDGRA